MGNHRPTVIPLDDGDWAARCTCRAAHRYASVQEAEDWVRTHEKDVERIRARISTTQPSLPTVRDHYLAMAEDPETADDDRLVWRQLADEISHRLNESGADDGTQDALF